MRRSNVGSGLSTAVTSGFAPRASTSAGGHTASRRMVCLGARIAGVAIAAMGFFVVPSAMAQVPPTLTKTFGASSIPIGASTALTFTVGNPNAGTTLTNINFFDSLPSGLVVATPNGFTNTCGGNFSAGAGVTFLTMDSVTLAPATSCTWKVDVVANSAGTKSNVTSAISSTQSAAGSTASATLNVPLPSPPTLSKAFGAPSVAIGQVTSLTFTVGNPNATFTTLTNINFFDSLPSGLVVATPNGFTNTCGGNFSAGAGVSFLTMDSVTLAPATSCTWKVDVVASTAGTKANVTSAISSTQSAAGSTASASLTVTGPPAFVSAVSRKVHGAAGQFDVPLSLVATNPSTEPRIGPTQTIVMTFDKPIASAGNPAVTEGTAAFSTMSISGNDVILNFTGVTDIQYVTITLGSVASTDGGSGGSGSVRLGFLQGDVNQSRVVTLTDLGLINQQLAQQVTQLNFLRDVNSSGTLTLTDKAIGNAALTHSLPPP